MYFEGMIKRTFKHMILSKISIVGFVLVYCNSGLIAQAARPHNELGEFLDKVAARIDSFKQPEDWTASVVTKTMETDKDGRPEKITVVNRIIRVAAGKRSDEILKVLETKSGRTHDITKEYIERQREERERASRRAESGERRGEGSRGGSRRMNIAGFIPFSEKRRPDFVFRLDGEFEEEGRRLVRVQVKSKVKDEQNWEGVYVIDAENYDIVSADLRPSKFPKFVKELEVKARIEILEGRYFFVRNTRFKVDGGNFIKRVRLIVEEDYQDIRLMESQNLVN